MDHLIIVHVPQPLGDLSDNPCDLLLGQLLFLLYLLQTTVGKQLDNHVDMFLIVKKSIEGSEVAVVEIALQLYLPQNVLLYFHILDLFLRYLLYHANKAYIFLYCHEYVPKSTFS